MPRSATHRRPEKAETTRVLLEALCSRAQSASPPPKSVEGRVRGVVDVSSPPAPGFPPCAMGHSPGCAALVSKKVEPVPRRNVEFEIARTDGRMRVELNGITPRRTFLGRDFVDPPRRGGTLGIHSGEHYDV